MKDTTQLTKAVENEDAICVLELMVRTEAVLEGLFSRFELEPTCEEQKVALLWAKELHKELKVTREAAGWSMKVEGDTISVSSKPKGLN